MSIWMESNVYTKSSISRSWDDLSFSQGLFTRILSTRPSIMRPRLMSFGGGEHHLSVFSSYIFLQHVSAFSVSSAHILAYQSRRSAKSPLKWSHRIWQLCEWNKDFLCVFTCHRVSSGLSEQKKKRSAHFSRSARMCERQFQTSDRVMDEGSEGHQSSAELSHSSS